MLQELARLCRRLLDTSSEHVKTQVLADGPVIRRLRYVLRYADGTERQWLIKETDFSVVVYHCPHDDPDPVMMVRIRPERVRRSIKFDFEICAYLLLALRDRLILDVLSWV